MTGVVEPLEYARDLSPGRENLVTRLIVTLRPYYFACILIIHLLAFNGQWRVSRDGALYRGIAENLVSTGKYQFRGQRETQVYPGLPLMLAGLQKLEAPKNLVKYRFEPVVPLIVMTVMGLLTLVLVYRLIALHYPAWIATAVTCGVGINPKYLGHCQSLLTDVPFLLGVCAAILGHERNQLAQRPAQRVWALVLMTGGIILAAAMRPTFWALALAWIAAALWHIGRGFLRRTPGIIKPAVISLAVLIALGALWMGLNKKTRGVNPLRGKYEAVAWQRLEEVDQARWGVRLHRMLDDHVPDAFFGLELIPYFNIVLSVLIFGGAVALFRRHPLWGLYSLITIVMTLFLGSVPRYYLMMLPFMLLGWALLLQFVADRIPASIPGHRWAPALLMFVGLNVVTVPCLVKSFQFLMEQHGYTAVGPEKFTKQPFYRVNRDGDMYPVIKLSEVVRKKVRRGQKVIGPEPRILSYLSGRSTFLMSEIIGKRVRRTTAERIRRKGFQWIVYPTAIYRERDEVTWDLLRKGVISLDKKQKSTRVSGGLRLGKLIILDAGPATRPSTRPTALSTNRASTKSLTTRPQATPETRQAEEKIKKPKTPMDRRERRRQRNAAKAT
jgi:hypothetical protein